MFEFFIAKKHILEKKKQSIIGIIGIMIGITVLIVSIGISNGLDKNMIDSILSLSSHVSVYDVNDKKEYEKLEKEIRKIPEVKGVLPKISTQGLIKYKGIYGDYISGVKIEGFDIKKAQEAIELDKKIVAGKIDYQKKNGIYIGNELYKQLGAKIGNKITVVSAENQELPFEIAGVFESGYYEYDINMVIIPLETAQYMMYMEDRITNLEITLYNPYEAEKISNELFEKFGVFNRTWGSQNKNLLSALALEKTVMIIVFSLIVVIAGFVVWVIMNMLVREKIKDIGIMRAMGFTKKNIMKIFLIEGLLLGVIGIFIGVILSLGILWYIKNYSIAGITSIYYLSKVPIEISAKEIFIIVFINFIVIFLSSIFPAYRAGKMETMEALRYE
ncbi:MAG: ABC transporter permease [Fusobacterium perfoetens]|uniref:ABC transporter permease n=1 Tax=Fusobacterium perfoetens TaxID=852 RepID=UPI0023F47A01|nr:ABC transporter permease [Fusobacterium perfoetens]MCI6152523.1 ABC transporter permease [Fusobacterium perfoetens]MDY3237531.1 ABC transporter permease [Fusobacterium perfoetens]